MPSSIHHPRALLDWQARAVRSRSAHLYRVSHDGRGNWTVTRPGSGERHYFLAELDTPPSRFDRADAVLETQAPLRPDAPSPAEVLTPAEKYAAEVRSSYPDLGA